MPDPAPPRAASLWLIVGNLALVLWLWFARCAFTGAPFRWLPDAAMIAPAAVGLAWAAGLHRPGERRLGVRMLRAAVFALALSAVAGGLGTVGLVSITWAGALWLGAACGAALGLFGLGFDAARSLWADRPGEAGRWLLVAIGATAITLPFYRRTALGSGDAYWYTIMLADFVAQVRHGIVPAWVGQSEFAFNGAVLPLRVAPWFQYMGGLLDLLTCHSLTPTALKNTVICVNGLAVGAAAYGGLRIVLSRRPGIAAALALLWILCPGVLAPLYLSDQYMTFMAMPFLPVLAAGCWLIWARDGAAARILIVVGVAGLWLSHTPMALWGSLLAAGMCAGRAASRAWRGELRRLAGMGLLFLALGSLPIGSALTIDNPSKGWGNGEAAWSEIQKAFPKSLEPIRSDDLGLPSYQLGYALLAAAAAALVLLVCLRPPAGVAFALAIPALGVFAVPVPWLTRWIWVHLPTLFVTINNVWPMQRLYSIWGVVAAFALATAAADPRIGGRPRRAAAVLALLAVGCAWSASQAVAIIRPIRTTFAGERETEVPLRPENLLLTRYAYTSFAQVPEYFSHGYMDPLLENRILARDTLAVMTSNAEAAAPLLRPDSDSATVPRLVESGFWTGESDNHSRIYILRPSLDRLEPGQRYALRLDFRDPPPHGLLQIAGSGLFREYLLPDSGVGVVRTGPPMAFGALPTNERVVPLLFRDREPEAPAARFYPGKYVGERIDFAHFWLFSYDIDDLPVRVRSWIPYRAETDTAVPAYLETPRIWQRGWRAVVNGRPAPVLASPHHLAMIPIEPGSSAVVLTFRAPAWLTLLFWITVAGWAAVGLLAFSRLARAASASAEPLP